MRWLLREPLVHFLLLGLALFLVFERVSPQAAQPDRHVIVADRDTLLTFVQFRRRAFDRPAAEAWLAALPTADREALVADFAREEALYREALALGMDRDDYVIRRRLVQKLEFIAEGVAESDAAPDDAAVRAYYDGHLERYRRPPRLTFTHVFFAADPRGPDAARALAEAELERLRTAAVPFAEAGSHGERFLYQRNYVLRPPDDIAREFGAAMAASLFGETPPLNQWIGPFQSDHGAHLVMIAGREPGGTPPLEEVRNGVRQDLVSELVRANAKRTVDEIVARYRVEAGAEGAAANGRN